MTRVVEIVLEDSEGNQESFAVRGDAQSKLTALVNALTECSLGKK